MSLNKLAQQKSPYLLQHAHNPVDWYPWSDEAFARAKEEDKPIFLSIGYATCHWCHVMERESFENPAIAGILNQHFISIKVDREERPDVDRVYMLFVQASTGSGGWPMSVFLTPQGKPFFGGTYFPPDNRYGRPGFAVLLERLAQAWREDRRRIEESGAAVIKQLAQMSTASPAAGIPGQEVWDRTFQAFLRSYDSALGGFGRAPKFPRPSIHNFLLRYWAETKSAGTDNEDALEMVLGTLRAMAAGGMHDQLGGGFHRYSVDQHWLVPHFEKMLYDQAQLAQSYLEAFQITRDGQYAVTARRIFEYVLRDLTSPQGAFFSAEDADSAADAAKPNEKGEGAFYIWTQREIQDALGPDAKLFASRYGVQPEGNVEDDPHGEFRGRNILHIARSVEEASAAAGMPLHEATAKLRRGELKLLEIRGHRPRPLLDDKVICAWNGLMISAFAKGAQILNEASYSAAARRAIDHLKTSQWDAERKILKRRYRDGEAAIDGFLDDYAFLGLALLDQYETTFERADLDWATVLTERAIELFADREHGGFFSAPATELVLPLKDDYDGAEPAGNSAMILLLMRLARMRERQDFAMLAENALRAFASRLEEAGTGLPQMLVAHIFALGVSREIVFAGPMNSLLMGNLLAVVRRRFLPGSVLLAASDCPRQMPAMGNAPTAYVCQDFSCKMPVTTASELDELLE